MDIILKIAGLVLLPASIAVKAFASPNTVAYHVADYVQQVLVGLGIYSSTGAVQAKIQQARG